MASQCAVNARDSSDNAPTGPSDTAPQTSTVGGSAALIRDVADRVCGLLASYRDLDDDLLRDPRFNGSKRKDRKRLEERVRRAGVLPPDQRAREAAERERCAQERARIGEALADEWERLSRTTFPAHDPDAMREMHAFLRRILEEDRGRFQRRGNLLFSLVRLGNAIDHPQAGWYVATWLLAAVSQSDWVLAESLMATVYEHPEVALLVTSNKPETLALLPLSRALIALKRDGDWAGAIEHARDARRTCGFDPRAAATCAALEAAHRTVRDHVAAIEDHRQRNGTWLGHEHGYRPLPSPDAVEKAHAAAFDVEPLLTRSLEWSPPRGWQIEHAEPGPPLLEHAPDA